MAIFKVPPHITEYDSARKIYTTKYGKEYNEGQVVDMINKDKHIARNRLIGRFMCIFGVHTWYTFGGIVDTCMHCKKSKVV